MSKNPLPKFLKEINRHLDNMLGYPAAQDFNYDELFPFFRYPINNIGDPFVEGTAKDNCHHLEREVLEFWANLL